MARGYRLHHPVERNCTYIVQHPRKDYHLKVDNDGDVIVSETVFDRLIEVNLGGMLFLNVVNNPPKTFIRMREDGPPQKVRIVRASKHG